MSNLPPGVTDAMIDASAALPLCDAPGCTREMDRHINRFMDQPARSLCETHYQEERELRREDMQIARERRSPLFELGVSLMRLAGGAR